MRNEIVFAGIEEGTTGLGLKVISYKFKRQKVDYTESLPREIMYISNTSYPGTRLENIIDDGVCNFPEPVVSDAIRSIGIDVLMDKILEGCPVALYIRKRCDLTKIFEGVKYESI